MAVPVAALAKIAAAALSDEDTRKRFGWIVAAICSPLILTLALICAFFTVVTAYPPAKSHSKQLTRSQC